tara:strand:- start:840 stop:1298 length:459 start_codon:yes stop_codon:yes gene_type:complete
MNKLNLTEQEKNRIRGLHDSYKSQHGTIIKEEPKGARFGVGFKEDMPEQSVVPADILALAKKAIAPQEWSTFWTKAQGLGDSFTTMMEDCDEATLKDWMGKNTECQMANIVQNENCKMSFEKAVNLVGVLMCLGAKKASSVMDMLKGWGTQG